MVTIVVYIRRRQLVGKREGDLCSHDLVIQIAGGLDILLMYVNKFRDFC